MESPMKRVVDIVKKVRLENPEEWMLREVLCVIVCCKKCGKLRRFTEYNP